MTNEDIIYDYGKQSRLQTPDTKPRLIIILATVPTCHFKIAKIV